jgi:MSHA biogenesis protein MshO
MAPDTVAGGSAYIDTGVATSAFDVLSPLSQIPTNGDWVVIGNQNGGDVYAGTNRGAVATVTTPATGLHRINLTTAKQFPVGYDGGRFVVVPNAAQTVFYACHDRTLYRGSVNTITGVFTQLADQAACSSAGGAVVATDVENCTFVYDPNQGATQQSGFVWMRLELSRSGESAALAHGVHVDNVP